MPLQHHLLGYGPVPSSERNSDRISVFAPSPSKSMRKTTGMNSQANETERISHRQECTVSLQEASLYVCVYVRGVGTQFQPLNIKHPKMLIIWQLYVESWGKGRFVPNSFYTFINSCFIVNTIVSKYPDLKISSKNQKPTDMH